MESKLLLLFLLIPIILPKIPPSSGAAASYARFTFDASLFPPVADYDYIVVGGGTAGCPLAATLSASHRVLLLERGGPPNEFPSLGSLDGFFQTLVAVDDLDSPAESFTSEDGVPNARGRVLGGSSAINAGFYSRAHPEFYKASGVEWDRDLVEESYLWVERAVTFRPELRRWQLAVKEGLIRANVTPDNGFTVQHLEGTKIGASTFDSSGRRHTAADLLALANGDNLRVATRAYVNQILLNSSAPSSGYRRRNQHRPSAVGVMYRDRFGNDHLAMTRPGGEVILSAGALGSPQLLLISGIGPRRHLTSLGISIAADHPNVGRFVYDNPRNGIYIIPSVPLEHSLIQVVGITRNGTFLEAASNVVTIPSRRPHFPFLPNPSHFLPNPPTSTHIVVATIIEKITGPTSVGSLQIASRDVRDTPLVRFNYFATKEDLDRCIVGVRKVGEVLEAESMDEFRMSIGWWHPGMRREFRFVGEALPPDSSSDEVVGQFCRRTVSTIWHYHGGCVVGKVVDKEYRVTGIGGLRVIDGSTFTVSPGTNPQATVMMMGRYMGRKINRERHRIMNGASDKRKSKQLPKSIAQQRIKQKKNTRRQQQQPPKHKALHRRTHKNTRQQQ